MLRRLSRRRVGWIAAVSLIVAGPAFALLQFIPGQVWQAAVPVTPAAAYLLPATISPGLYGDNITGIEVGRDDRSPFVAIVVLFGPPPPPPTALVANPLIGALGPYLPLPVSPPPPYPPPPPGFFYLRFIYRPINDPANPGWGGLPGAPNQLDNAMQTCLQVAAELSAFRAVAQTPAGAPPVVLNPASPAPQLYFEFVPVSAVSYFEFYKFHIVR
jgi:hypothetical protein